jgi:hypothetical protein
LLDAATLADDGDFHGAFQAIRYASRALRRQQRNGEAQS